ncbi:MAG: SDR family oxidoreductase [SAR324 cluster bacterium]|nr:SDR family oxidoreductase [SAR324 cluster bacterium]
MSPSPGNRRVALVSGAARGNGLAIAEALARTGATVYLADIGHDLPEVPYPMSSAADLERAAEGLRDIHQRVHALQCDVRSPEDVAAAVRVVESEAGRLDILVNNAGVLVLNPVEKVSTAEWDVHMDVIVKGAFLLCQAALPGMNQRGWGRVINIASVAAHRGLGTGVAYTAAKHAMIGLTRALAMEVARQNVTVNAVCPGTTPTELVHGVGRTLDMSPEETLAIFSQRHLTQKPIAKEDVAAATVWLASDAAGRVNGTSLFVDDGWHCH